MGEGKRNEVKLDQSSEFLNEVSCDNSYKCHLRHSHTFRLGFFKKHESKKYLKYFTMADTWSRKFYDETWIFDDDYEDKLHFWDSTQTHMNTHTIFYIDIKRMKRKSLHKAMKILENFSSVHKDWDS